MKLNIKNFKLLQNYDYSLFFLNYVKEDEIKIICNNKYKIC